MNRFVLLSVFSLTFVFSSSVYGVTIVTTLDTTAPTANPEYTATTGQQTGRINRLPPVSTCDSAKPNMGLLTATGARQYDSYVFTPVISGCVQVTLSGGNNSLFVVVYNSSGFVPATPFLNYLADPSVSPIPPNRSELFFNAVAGEQYTVVVSEVDPGGGVGTNYFLTVDPVVPLNTQTTLDTLPPGLPPRYLVATGVQTGRLSRNGIVSNCTAMKANPGLTTATGARQFDSYKFTASRTGCVTVNLLQPAAAPLMIAVYNNTGFVPATPNVNYLADPGSSSPASKFSFKVIAGETFTIVVHEEIPTSGIGTAYSLRVSEAISQTPFDFDGDNKTDIGIFRPAVSGGEWWVNRSSNGATFALQFGASTDKIVPGDYTGDGKADIALWRPTTGQWFILRSEDFSFFAFPFGTNGDVPVPADYDADGKADYALFRPSNSTWFVSQSAGAPTRIFQFGIAGDQPVVGDYDLDGHADVAIFRPGPREWWIQRSTAGSLAMQFGSTGDKPVQGDYTGDGKTDVALWRPSTGEWFIVRSEDLSFFGFPFGTNGDTPSPGEYDGDGKFDAAIFRPSNSTWFITQSTGAPTRIVQFGANGDKPLPNAFVP